MSVQQAIPQWQQAILDKCLLPGAKWTPVDKQAMMHQSIPELFEAQVVRTPDRLAIKTRAIEYSYAELNRAANTVAHSILAEGQDRTRPVALCFSQRAHLLAGIFGVLKTGRFLVNLDQHFSPEQNRQIIADSQPDLLCTDLDSVNFDQSASVDFPRIIRTDRIKSLADNDNLLVDCPPNPIARIVYTSGSTGRPKGVVQTRQQIAHGIANFHNLVRFSVDDKLLYISTTGFTSPFVPLHCGGTLFPIDLKMEGLPVLAERIRVDGATVIDIVPTVLRHFVNTLRPDEILVTPRVISFIGEPVPRKHFELFRHHFPQTTFIHFLGSKECLDYRAFALGPNTPVTDDHLPAGYAVDDTEVMLVDSTGRYMEGEGIGEIVVKSPYIASGYWGNPALTAQKFREDPSGNGQHIYFTGDLGRFLPDGCLVTAGRNDFQVKIRGLQVRTDEVEAILARVDGVAECAIVVNNEQLGDLSLDAYVVTSLPSVSLSAVRAALGKELPDHMIPARFIFLDKLPYTPMGKVDRNALRSTIPGRPSIDAPFVLAGTPIEQLIVTIWADILGLDAIGIHDPFLDLGGNSLPAMRIAARVQDEFGVEIPLAELFAARTVAEMALVLTAKLANDTDITELIDE